MTTETASKPAGVDYGSFSFSIKRFIFAQLAEQAAAAVPSSPGLPVYGCFQVKATDAGITLAATDMELTIFAFSPAVSAASDLPVFYLPARKLLQILKEAPNGDVHVEVKKNFATITAGSRASWQLKLPDGDSYPELPELYSLGLKTVKVSSFLGALKTVRHTVCRDASRPPLMQVVIGPGSDGQPVITSSDGVRLTRAPAPGFPQAMAIPAGALDQLTKLLAASPAEECEVGETAASEDTLGSLVFRVGAATLAVQKTAADFPDLDGLVLKPAQENEDELTADRSDLQAALRRVRITVEPETSAIALEVTKGGVNVVSRDGAGNSAVELVSATWAGDDRLLVVNSVALYEMLAAHPSASATFRIGKDMGKRRSMVLLEDKEAGVLGIIPQMAPALVGY